MRTPPLAAFGQPPAFSAPLHVAQVNLPEWGRVENAFRGIFERRYFANHGPLVRELETRFAETVGVGHALAMTNGTVALMVLARALELTGEVIVPAFTFPATAQALIWAGLKPVVCDVDPRTHMLEVDLVRPLVTDRTSAILGVHAWGRACDPDELEAFTRDRGLVLFFDACHAIACTHSGKPIGRFGAAEVFSFHATKIMNAAEGGCVVTNDAGLAKRLRTIRSFHQQETFGLASARLNGKMSEAQAALALLSLDDLTQNVFRNRQRYQAYAGGLSDVPGVSLIRYSENEGNNFQYIIVDVDADRFGVDRDLLLDLLGKENVVCRRHFYPGIHRALPAAQLANPDAALPVTDWLSSRLLQLPSGQSISPDDVARICDIIRTVHRYSKEIKNHSSDQK